MFRRNVGGIDRLLRLILGPVFLIAGLLLFAGKASLGLTLVVVGLLALFTGIVRFCVLYVPFGISTAPGREHALAQTCDCAALLRELQSGDDPVGKHAPTEKEAAAAGSRG